MTNHMQNAIKQIFENENLSKKLIKLETLDEILELFKSIDNNISKEDFEEGINELLEKSSEKLTDETLSEISGGALNKNFKKSLAATLAALSVGSSQIYAAPQTTSKTSKVISAALLTALGVTGATALGAMLYHIMNKPGDLADTDLKDIYYGLLMDTNSEQLEEAFNALAKLNGTNENFGQEFNKILKEKGIDPTQLKAGDAKELFKDKNFFISLPLSVIEKISPKEIRNKVEKIKSSKEEQSKNSTPETSTSKGSKQQASASKGSKQQTLTPGSSSFIKGLQNIGNSCHLNATLQLLRQIPEVREGNVKPKEDDDDKTVEKINSLNEVMKAINTTSKGEITDKNFTEKAGKLIELLHPGKDKNGCPNCKKPQDASEDLFGLNLHFDHLGIESLSLFNPPKGFVVNIKNINSKPDDVGGDVSGNPKYKLFTVNNPNRKIFRESYELNDKEYKLKSVVCNSGAHYYAYSKDENGVWYKCDDNKVESATFEDITENPTFPTMFLYSRVDKTQN